ncbi:MULTISPECIES: hypothetical protein [Mycolicibacterium]|nr:MULTISPECIES: hypothetical protein [Mycolicibacterium]
MGADRVTKCRPQRRGVRGQRPEEVGDGVLEVLRDGMFALPMKQQALARDLSLILEAQQRGVPQASLERRLADTWSTRLDHILHDPNAPTEFTANTVRIRILDEIFEIEEVELMPSKSQHGSAHRRLPLRRRGPAHESTGPVRVVGDLPQRSVPRDVVCDRTGRHQELRPSKAELGDGQECTLPRLRLAGHDVQPARAESNVSPTSVMCV